ncbi:hypothetical protein [Gilvibacter sp.]|uniref:hypothetical protein n=1 Tax=Gilvibacter sp. TaxID=2729997 RepID=UPI0025BA7BC8|nr:hypothetical protein [Gilvibacter sp.]NQX77693.1 hypothetical protein [Gilvibacter sp.]
MNKWLLTLLFVCIGALAYSQSYRQDSLQIIGYTVINYIGSHPQKIDVTKVFCDYCNEQQVDVIKKQAWSMTYDQRYAPENRIEEGERRLALFIRIAKKDFSKLNNEEGRRR